MEQAKGQSPDALDFSRITKAYVDGWLAHFARWVGYNDQRLWVRIFAITLTCAVPFALAIICLPFFASGRQAFVERLLGSTPDLTGFWSSAGLGLAILSFLSAILVTRAWSANERERQLHLLNGAGPTLDKLPDMRLVALLSAVVIFALVPFLMFFANRIGCLRLQSCLYTGPTSSFEPWLIASADRFIQASTFSLVQYVSALPDISTIQAASPAGRALEIVVRVTLQLFVLSVLIGIIRIRSMTNAAVRELKEEKAVISDPRRLAVVRLGKRALPILYDAINSSDKMGEAREDQTATNHFSQNAARVLQQIGDRTSFGPLIAVFRQVGRNRSWARWRALRAMTAIAKRLQRKEDVGWLARLLNMLALLRLKLWVWWEHRTYERRPEGQRSKRWGPLLVELYGVLWTGG